MKPLPSKPIGKTSQPSPIVKSLLPIPIVKPSLSKLAVTSSPSKSIREPLTPPKSNHTSFSPESNVKLEKQDKNVQNIDTFDTA
ncbi:hypothetical protein BLA29_014924, partial [Euroglyphus maynei]